MGMRDSLLCVGIPIRFRRPHDSIRPSILKAKELIDYATR